jgi:hypothetical protein
MGLSLALRMLAVAGKRDHSLGIFAMLAAEFVFIHDAGATGVGTLLGSRHGYLPPFTSLDAGKEANGEAYCRFLEWSNEVESLRLCYFSGW